MAMAITNQKIPFRVINGGFMAINIIMGLYVYQIASTCSSAFNEHTRIASLTAYNARSVMIQHKRTAEESFQQWLEDYSDTPGAKLVALLHQEVYYERSAEATRLRACQKGPQQSYSLCFGGLRNLRAAESTLVAAVAETSHQEQLEQTTSMPRYPNMTVYEMRRFSEPNKIIYSLGTDPVCFPLVLAGASVEEGVIVELGTFVGLSTKCMALGLNTTKRTGQYYAFDFFGHHQASYSSIIQHMPWVAKGRTFTVDSSYKWLWESAVKHVYPSIRGFEGEINKDTLHPEIWDKQSISLLSIQSAKLWKDFHDQFDGIQKPFMLKRGAILVLMDFLTIDVQVKLFYGCWREFLQPVYSSWCQGNQWIFVVTKTFSLSMVGSCVQDLLGEAQVPTDEKMREMEVKIVHDVDFLDGLFGLPSDSMKEERECMALKLNAKLHEEPGHWRTLKME